MDQHSNTDFRSLYTYRFEELLMLFRRNGQSLTDGLRFLCLWCRNHKITNGKLHFKDWKGLIKRSIPPVSGITDYRIVVS